jgi:hypothetical protein
MNRRHKTVLALSLAVAGLGLLGGEKLSEALGIILVGASLAWLIGSQFVLVGAQFVWKHRIWLVIIITLGSGAVYGWIRYAAYQAEKQDAEYKAKMKPIWDCEGRNSQFSDVETQCEKDPSVTLQPITVNPTPQPTYSPHSSFRSPSVHVKATYDTELTTTQFGSLKCGLVRAGEVAVLLIDAGLWVKNKNCGRTNRVGFQQRF